MYQIDNATAAATLPTPAAPGTAGYFTGGNPASGTPATVVDADLLNAVMMELINVVQGGGVPLSKTSQSQAIQALRRLFAGNVSTFAVNTTLTTDNAGLVNANATAGSITLTLPAAAVVAGFPIYYDVVRTDTATANTVTITPHGTDTIDGLSSITIPVGSYRGIVCDGAGIWRTVSITPPPVAECRLSWTSATVLTLAPIGGGKVNNPASGVQQIPAAGITAPTIGGYVNGAVGNVAASTTYWIYEFSLNGVATLDLVTTTWALDPISCMPIKTGDNTRVLVGRTATNASSQFIQNNTISFWNRSDRTLSVNNTWSVASGSPTTTSIAVSFSTWADDAVFAQCDANGSNSTASSGFSAYLYFDAGSVAGPAGWTSLTAGVAGHVPLFYGGNTSEGAHTLTLEVATSSGGSASGSGTLVIKFRG